MKDRFTQAIWPLLASSFCLYASVGVGVEAPLRVTFCDLLALPQQYETREVATEAMIESTEHEVHVYSEKCKSSAEVNRSASLELPRGWNSTRPGEKLSKILRHGQVARVRFEALFESGGGPYGQERTRFHFVLRRVVSVEEALEPHPESGYEQSH